MLSALSRIWPWLLVAVLLAYGLQKVPPRFSFQNDSLIKLVQAQALAESNFSREELPYAFRSHDPEYRFYPFGVGNYHLKVGGRHYGPFAIAPAALTALFLEVMPYHWLPLLSCLVAIGGLLLLRLVWQVRGSALVVALACTPVLLYTVEFSEIIWFAVLGLGGVSILYADASRARRAGPQVLAGVLLGVAFWFRMEAIVLVLGVLLAQVLLAFPDWRRGTLPERARAFFGAVLPLGLVFSLFVLAFLGFNQWDYGHPFGPRYLAEGGDFERGIAQRLQTVYDLLFVNDGALVETPGFFGAVPLFAFVLLLAIGLLLRRRLDPSATALLVATLVFLFLAPLLAPHSGRFSWGGRYMVVLILPLCVLLDRVIAVANTWQPVARWAVLLVLIGSGLYSAHTSNRGLMVYRDAVIQMRGCQEDFARVPADIRLFRSKVFSMHMGPQYLEVPALAAESPEDLKAVLRMLKAQHSGKRLVLFESLLYNTVEQMVRGGSGAGARDQYLELLNAGLVFERKIPLQNFRNQALVYRIP